MCIRWRGTAVPRQEVTPIHKWMLAQTLEEGTPTHHLLNSSSSSSSSSSSTVTRHQSHRLTPDHKSRGGQHLCTPLSPHHPATRGNSARGTVSFLPQALPTSTATEVVVVLEVEAVVVVVMVARAPGGATMTQTRTRLCVWQRLERRSTLKCRTTAPSVMNFVRRVTRCCAPTLRCTRVSKQTLRSLLRSTKSVGRGQPQSELLLSRALSWMRRHLLRASCSRPTTLSRRQGERKYSPVLRSHTRARI